jgi:integrase
MGVKLVILSDTTGLPRACNSPSYCYTFPTGLIDSASLLDVASSTLEMLHPSAVAIACASTLYSMRVSELLSLESKHLICGDRVVVTAGKGSQSYTIWLPLISEHCTLVSDPLCDGRLFPVDYTWIYRQLKRAGMSVKKKSGINNSVTHSHRYATASAVASILGADTAGDVLHHKSNKSVAYYL